MILFGFKKCGKTYYGKRIAKELGLPFLDTDQRLEEVYSLMTGEFLTFREIFRKLGQETFRELETHVIEGLKGLDNTIIAVGGGAILNYKNREILEKLGKMVYLKIAKEPLKERLLYEDQPLYLDVNDLELSFEKMYADRKPLYEKIPAIWIDTTGKSEEDVVEMLNHLMKPGKA